MSMSEVPLDAARVDAVLANAVALKAAMSAGGAGVDPALWKDLGRLWWIADVLPGDGDVAPGASPAEWLPAARDAIGRMIAMLRAWPAGLGMGGPQEEAERLGQIGDAELEAIAPRAREVAEFMAFMKHREGPPPTQLQPEDREARKWLQPKTVRTMLAGNRFEDAADALRFVESLYEAGAERVVVASESMRKEGPKDRYADALRVILPADAERRARVFEICNREAAEEGFDPDEDTGQRVLYLWWD